MFTSSLILKSYSKINVSLRVLGKREDAYHLLEMVNLPLELHDIIEISKFPHAEDTFITCDDIGLQKREAQPVFKSGRRHEERVWV
jgi:4-diphosphocytidyl-2-C-methyl-D-erythritol kinase